MKQSLRRFAIITLTLLVFLSSCFIVSAQNAPADDEITILFTNDLHSHLLPSANENGEGEYGGYARLMTLIHQ